jgi:hypothetical protein
VGGWLIYNLLPSSLDATPVTMIFLPASTCLSSILIFFILLFFNVFYLKLREMSFLGPRKKKITK